MCGAVLLIDHININNYHDHYFAYSLVTEDERQDGNAPDTADFSITEGQAELGKWVVVDYFGSKFPGRIIVSERTRFKVRSKNLILYCA